MRNDAIRLILLNFVTKKGAKGRWVQPFDHSSPVLTFLCRSLIADELFFRLTRSRFFQFQYDDHPERLTHGQKNTPDGGGSRRALFDIA
jgi:hypothetical protein